jgi:hypothetical protein
LERIVQYLDELEDLVCAMLTIKERIRRALQILFVLVTSLLLQALGILLALSQPPLALAAVSLLIVGMMYKSVTSPISRELVLS